MAATEPDRPAPAARAAEKAEAASAGLVLQALVKAERGFAIYLPNNPLHGKFFEDLRQRLDAHLEKFGDLQLGLTHDSVVCCGEVVYTNAELRENLAFRMYADGIRALRIEPGIEPRELRTLVEILGRPAAEADEDDIVTRLWSSDLPHVSYLLAELPTAGGGVLAAAAAQAPQEAALRRFAAELAAQPPSPVTTPPPLAQQIFSLSGEELAALQDLIAGEERRSPLEDMTGIVEAVITSPLEEGVLEEFLEIIARLCGDLLVSSRVDEAVGLLAMLARTAARPDLPPDRAAKIEAARSQVVTVDVLAGLSRLLAGAGVERGLLQQLVAALGRSAIEPFCHILGEVSGKETRKALIESLAEVGWGAPGLFLPFLRDPRWYLVRNTIFILRRIADPEVAREVSRCASHEDPRVRREVLLFFDESGDPAAESVLLGFLGDESPPLRVAAIRGLARHGSRAAADRLLDITAAPGFVERERIEREAAWEALGALAPARALPALKAMLLRRRWFGQAKDLDDTAVACAGLKRVGTPQAVEILREAAAGKRGEAREVIEKTLRALERGRTTGEGSPGRDGGGAELG